MLGRADRFGAVYRPICNLASVNRYQNGSPAYRCRVEWFRDICEVATVLPMLIFTFTTFIIISKGNKGNTM